MDSKIAGPAAVPAESGLSATLRRGRLATVSSLSSAAFEESRGPAASKLRDAIFRRMLLLADALAIAGAFVLTVSLSTREMDMSFVTESPHEISIPILTPILQETRNELLQLSVTGTLENPKITPVPLSAISNLLRAFFPRPHAAAR